MLQLKIPQLCKERHQRLLFLRFQTYLMRKVLLLHQVKENIQFKFYLLLKGRFEYNVFQDILISPAWCFNQMLLNFNQYFASDVDYLLLLGLCMCSSTYIHQLTLLCTKLTQVHSQQEQLKIILKKPLTGYCK